MPFKDAPPQGPEAALTFAPLPVEGPKHHQVSCVGHGALVQIVLLHFQPVALSRLVSSLRRGKRDHKRAWRHRDRGFSPAQAFPSGNESWGKGRKRLGLPLAAYLLGSGLVLRPSCLLSPFILTTFLWGGQDDSIFQIRRLKLKEGLQGSPLANHQALQARRG